MKKITIASVLFLLMSCNESVEEKQLVSEEITHEIIVQDSISKPSNVVAPEEWSSLEEDINMAILFYKGDSLMDFEQNILSGLKEEFKDLEFHEFYSDDNLAQVFLNDTLAFDLSNYMSEKTAGFVLLKPGFSPQYEFLDDSLQSLKANFHEFYGNK